MFWWAIALSALGHVGAFGWAALTAPSTGEAAALPATLDGLGGPTTGIGAVPGAESVYEVEALEGPAGSGAPAAPAATPAAPPAPPAEAPPAPKPSPPKPPAEPPARPHPAVAKAPKPAAEDGDDPYEAVDAERAKSAKSAGKSADSGDGAAAGGAAQSAAGELGGHGGAGDLGRALTRALPAANQGDGSWRELEGPFAGSIEVRIPIDAEGRVGGFEPLAPEPSPRLVKLVRRTLALIVGGTFALREGTLEAGAQIVRFAVRVAPSADAPSGPQALAFEYENGHGTASFVPDGGARVEVRVEVLRVERGGDR